MKVILINPPSQRRYGKQQKVTGIVPPLGLAYLASYLQKKNIDVNIIDCYALGLSLEDTEKILKRTHYDIIGLTATTLSLDISLAVLRQSKKNNPNCTTILGGPHSSALPIKTLEKNPFLDIVVRGEGEITFCEVVTSIEKNKSLSNVKGISFRDKNRIIHNSDSGFIEDLDSVPFPAYNLLPMEKYRPAAHHALGFGKKVNETPYFPIFTSRGCPFMCTFCASAVTWKRKVRFRSPENVLEEIDLLVSKYKIKNLDIYDDTFTLVKDRTNKILDLLSKRHYDLDFSCLSRVDHVNKEIIQKLKSTGCYSMRFGIESGSPEMLEKMRKGFTIEQVEKAFKIIKSNGIARNACFIFGHPGETGNAARQTINFAKKIEPDLAFFYILIPLPGTEVAKIMEKKNLIVSSNTANWTFITDHINIKTEHLSAEHLIKIRKRAYREFYLRPHYIISKLLQIKNFYDIRQYYKGFLAFLASA